MKNFLLVISFTLCSFCHAYSQGLIVSYEETTNFRMPRPDLREIDNPMIRAAIESSFKEREEQMKKPSKAQLSVSNGLSVYSFDLLDAVKSAHSEKTVNVGNSMINMNSNMQFTGPRTIYKDHHDKLHFTHITFSDGRAYLIEKPLKELSWKIGKKRKEVSGYQCYEATAKKSDGAVVVAWYTPDIPVSEGPGDYFGLPGLILYVDVDNGSTIYSCTAITQVEDLAEIQIPENMERITNEQYRAIASEQMQQIEEMMERRRQANDNNPNVTSGSSTRSSSTMIRR